MSEDFTPEPTPPVTPTPTSGSPTPTPVAATGAIINGTTPDDRTMAMLAHLLGIPTGFVGPLIIWLIKKDQSEFVNDQGKEVINFHITVFLAAVVLFPALIFMSFIPLVGCLTFPLIIISQMALGIGWLLFHILGTIKANEGIRYRYPLNFRLIK